MRRATHRALKQPINAHGELQILIEAQQHKPEKRSHIATPRERAEFSSEKFDSQRRIPAEHQGRQRERPHTRANRVFEENGSVRRGCHIRDATPLASTTTLRITNRAVDPIKAMTSTRSGRREFMFQAALHNRPVRWISRRKRALLQSPPLDLTAIPHIGEG